MPYGTTDYQRGVLHALEHDIEPLQAKIEEIVNDLMTTPGDFDTGRLYVVTEARTAFNQAIAGIREDVEHQSSN